MAQETLQHKRPDTYNTYDAWRQFSFDPGPYSSGTLTCRFIITRTNEAFSHLWGFQKRSQLDKLLLAHLNKLLVTPYLLL